MPNRYAPCTLGLVFACLALGGEALAQEAPTSQPILPTSPAQSFALPANNVVPNKPSKTANKGFYLDDNGGNYQAGDFKWTFWGYGERILNTGRGQGYWRRFRLGSEIDFPRLTPNLRAAFVYEIDLVDSNFLTHGIGGNRGLGRRNFENLFFALQDANDPSKMRFLIGENTAIISREDNLPSGNLATVNRSLILEEHNGAGFFGAQFGAEFSAALNPKWTVSLAALDNRGSLNTDHPHYHIGNSLEARISNSVFDDTTSGRSLTWGVGVGDTRNIHPTSFSLLTAISQNTIGAVTVSGNKPSVDADIVYEFPGVFSKAATIEAEGLYSNFSGSHTKIGGGYIMLQQQVFDTPRLGNLDSFIRYDGVSLTTGGVSGTVYQQAFRIGINYNLPRTDNRVDFHFEYAHNRLSGPTQIVQSHGDDELVAELRFSLQPYQRH